MQKTITKKSMRDFAICGAVLGGMVFAAGVTAHYSVPSAHALGQNAKMNKVATIDPHKGFTMQYTPAPGMPPVQFIWGDNTHIASGKTTGFTTATQTTNGQPAWAAPNKPHQVLPLYDTNMHDNNQIRIANAGYILNADGGNSGQYVDLICTPYNEWNSFRNNPVRQGTAITGSQNVGNQPDSYHSITFLTSGNDGIQWLIKVVKSGTDTPINISTITYWSDIDVFQGEDENFTNDQAYWANTAGYLHDTGVLKHAWNTRWIWSSNQFDGQGMLDVDKTGYVGTGFGNNYRLAFASPFVKTDGQGNDPNAKIQGISIMQFCPCYRYDIFGHYNNLGFKFPPPVKNPQKKVTDLDEKQVTNDTLSLKEKDYQYDVTVDVGKGYAFTDLVFTDTLPQGDSTAANNVHLYNKAGKDVTGDFDVKVNGQQVVASIKNTDQAKEDQALMDTTLDMQIKAHTTAPANSKLVNSAIIHTGGKDADLKTNSTTTLVPPPPTTNKQVSVDGGKTFVPAQTPEEAAKLPLRGSDYIWRNNFKLSSHINFTKIVFNDHLKNLQAVDASKIHVYDWTGKDVTSQGKIAVNKTGNDTEDVVWTANSDYVNSVNKSFGRDSDKTPTFHMDIQTNIKNASDAQEAKYYNSSLKRVIIPNKTTLTEGDNSGDVSVDTNDSNVTPPPPTAPAIKKQVALAGTKVTSDDGWKSSLELKNHDQQYEYRTTYTLSKNLNFANGNLVLTDHFENMQKHGDIKLFDSKGNDITGDFNITTKQTSKTGVDFAATLKDEAAQKYNDTGATIYLVVNNVTWKGDTGAQEVPYMEHKEQLSNDHTATSQLNAGKSGISALDSSSVAKSTSSSAASSSSSATSASSTSGNAANSTTNNGNDADPFKVGITVPNQSELNEHSAIPGWSFDKKSNHTYVNFQLAEAIQKFVEDDNNASAMIDPSGRPTTVGISSDSSSAALDKNADVSAKAASDHAGKVEASQVSHNATISSKAKDE